MPRYVAFLRGVSPMNARMPELKHCFEAAGFSEVRTLLSSGNVVFDARSASATALERRAEKAMHAELGHSFGTFVRPAGYLLDLIEADPFAEFDLAPGAKRVVTFLRSPVAPEIALPIERDGASIIKASAAEVFSAYLPDPKKGPVFMTLLERSFGKDITTRTLDTVIKCARA
ncbi:DUF1697 domain-containing protein [Cupriavidus metallidurans]|uniref:DUF1697 domain-containing protein n=1 Tax=Cupriavidus metallidurans TaxID=119219 RepID=UPI00068D6DCB|nr:DUF1697 domain-containing protein [Cupriavidus metallidurans]